MAVTASDLEVTMKVAISVESEFDGRITIPARILIDTLKTFSNQPLTFVINLTNYSIEIISELGNYKLSGNNADEFPKSPTLTNSSTTFFKSEILQNAINKTLFASGNDDLRPVMSGVYCELSPEQVTFVATDAHKLVKHSRTDLSSDKTASLILPKKPLTILKNNIVDGIDVTLDFNDTNALFSFENNTIICRLIDGKYPNYDAVIPKENPNKLTIETSLLLSSIKRISIYANKTTHQIRLKVSGSELQISSEDLDFSNKADERLPCHYEGEDIEIGFNSKFVIDIILPLDGTVEGENTLMLVMPVMLNN
jgi:DNA polymerase-3 subunit beta